MLWWCPSDLCVLSSDLLIFHFQLYFYSSSVIIHVVKKSDNFWKINHNKNDYKSCVKTWPGSATVNWIIDSVKIKSINHCPFTDISGLDFHWNCWLCQYIEEWITLKDIKLQTPVFLVLHLILCCVLLTKLPKPKKFMFMQILCFEYNATVNLL